MGAPKALLRWGGSTWAAAHALALGEVAGRVIVVVGAGGDAVAASLPAGVVTVRNERWATTQPSDSARLALPHVPDGAARVLVTPVDVAPAERRWLLALAAAPPPAVPCAPGGGPGHPVVLGPTELARLRGEVLPEGLRSLLRGAASVPVDDPRIALDADTPEALADLRRAGRATSRGSGP